MARVATAATKVGEMLAAGEADMAVALAARDWDAVQVEARRLKAFDRLVAACGPDSGYVAAVLSGGGR